MENWRMICERRQHRGTLMVYDCKPGLRHANGKKNSETCWPLLPVSVSFNGTLMKQKRASERYVGISFLRTTGWKAGAMPSLNRLLQPDPATINLLFKHAFQTSLLKWSGNASDYANYIKSYWTSKLSSPISRDKAPAGRCGTHRPLPPVLSMPQRCLPLHGAASAKGGAMEAIPGELVSMGDGSQLPITLVAGIARSGIESNLGQLRHDQP